MTLLSTARFLHTAGIVHRDLKTLNLLVDSAASGRISHWR